MKNSLNLLYVSKTVDGVIVYTGWLEEHPELTAQGNDLKDVAQNLLQQLRTMLQQQIVRLDKNLVSITSTDYNMVIQKAKEYETKRKAALEDQEREQKKLNGDIEDTDKEENREEKIPGELGPIS